MGEVARERLRERAGAGPYSARLRAIMEFCSGTASAGRILFEIIKEQKKNS